MSDPIKHAQASTPLSSDTGSTPKPYSPPSVVRVGAWKTVTLVISGPVTDVGGSGLFEPLKYFGSD